MNRQDYLRQRYVWTSGETVVSTKPAAKVSRPPARTPSLAARVVLSRQRLINHPGHDQKSHGRKGRSSPGGMSGEEFDSRVAGAAHQSEALAASHIRPSDREMGEAISAYGGGGSYAANDALRASGGDREQITDWLGRQTAEGMDRAFEGSELGRDIVVVRGITDPSVTFGGREPRVGMQWVDHGYVSTSAQSSASEMFTGVEYDIAGGVEMRILAPKGTRAISSDRLVYDNEIVLDRGLTYRVVRDNGESFDGVRQLDIEVVGA